MTEAVKVGSEILVNTETAKDQNTAKITDLTNGGFVVTWIDYSRTLGDNSESSIKAQVFGANGTKVGSEFLVNTVISDYQYQPTITGLAGGGFVVAWADNSGTLNDSSGASIKAQVFGSGGGKVGNEFLVNTQVANDQKYPALTGLSNGDFVVVWQNYTTTTGNSTGSTVRAQLFAANGTMVGGEFDVTGGLLDAHGYPMVTGLANGRFVVSWTGLGIAAQVFNADGSKLGGPFAVSATPDGYETISAITALSGGGFVVTFEDHNSVALGDAFAPGIKAQVFGADGTKVGSEFLVNTQTWSAQYSPTVSGLPNGGFVITWWDLSTLGGDSSDAGIAAQMFNADGSKLGDQFLVNSQTFGTQSYPAIASLENGGFAVTWTDANVLGDGDEGSIKAQIFSFGNPPVITSDGGGDTAAVSIAENTTAVTTVTATDADAGTTLVYAISGGADAAKFEINSDTGALAFIAAPDFEVRADDGADNIYNVIVTASDGTLTDTQAIAVTVTDENDNTPVITSNGGLETAAISFGENGVAVTTVTATDADAGTALTYDITGGVDAGKFAIDAVTGELTFLLAPNFEAPTDNGADNIYDVIVSVSDGTSTDTQAIAVTVTDGPDTLTGTEEADNLIGLNGPDIIFGLGGNDTINGGTGRDTMYGGAGDDNYILDLNGDRVIELANEGTDTVLTVVAIYGLRDNVENLTFTYAEGGSSRGLGNALANVITGGTGADTLLGLDGNDTLLGMGGSDVLNGGLGNDLLNGGTGADTMVGGTGDDVFIVDNLGDIVREGVTAGNDRVESSVTFTISAGIEELTLTGAAAINGTGSRIANILTGNGGDNVLFGAGGADTLLGMDGNDTLNGGTGQDRLTGGLGGDTFLFASNSSASLGSTADVVTDFSRSEGDKLAFSKTIFTGLGAIGGLDAAAFQSGTVALDATDRIIYNQTTGELFYDADGNGRRAQVLVATIGDTVHSALAFDDFLIMA